MLQTSIEQQAFTVPVKDGFICVFKNDLKPVFQEDKSCLTHPAHLAREMQACV